jgi:hypothetical protein
MQEFGQRCVPMKLFAKTWERLDDLVCGHIFPILVQIKGYFLEIPRWRLEVGSRKRASYSEILERRWRHTLQA